MEGPIDFLHDLEGKKLLAFNLTHKPHLRYDLGQSLRLSESPPMSPSITRTVGSPDF